ncbi:DUF2953 domain-containing protein [Methanobacterium sp.]|uniref:DUF2953 domain-containing protein n=2 Tax=unclassified Methanobacterium TaxID=2627676 RepID=UPI003D6464D6
MVLIVLFLILIVLFAGIMLIPFQIEFMLDINGFKITGNFKIKWIGIKLIQKEIEPSKNTNKVDREHDIEDKGNNQDKSDKNNKDILRIITLIYESSPYLIRIFQAFLNSIIVEKFLLKLNIGLGDPYDTAMVFGYLSAARALINLIPKIIFSIEPDFNRECISAQIDFKFKIRLLKITVESLRALTKKPVRALLNSFRKMG